MSTPELTEAGISSREGEVLRALGEHLTNAEIAARLFISVRTVESHVSSLLRKLGVADRRDLAQVAATMAPAAGRPEPPPPQPHLPVPLTSFVGRQVEQDELMAAVTSHRLVTAMGPGGVGKTRLAIAVAAGLTGSFIDGAWFIDLVPVTDPALVGAAVASALGVPETKGGSVDDAAIARLAEREALLILDNCEHLLDGVAVFVERLLAQCPGVTLLATSQARLMLPFEWVFAVPGLAAGDDGGDAVALFVERAAAVDSTPISDDDRARIAEICRRLDGVALAIELAAARVPSLGLEGLESGLSDRLRVLTGGRRVDQRHESLRSTIDWSYQLLGPADQALLRRASVFASPFTVDAAVAVCAGTPLDPAAVGEGLARLADHSLVAVGARGTPRYRILETIRQYGAEQLDVTGELTNVHTRHLQWCLTTAASHSYDDDPDAWRPAFDEVSDDFRSALRWAVTQPGLRQEAHELAELFANLCFLRGIPGEAQRRFEQAATLAADAAEAAQDLRHAAEAALTRHVGNDALRLRREAANASIEAGDPVAAACDLAVAAAEINRSSGIIATAPPDGAVDALITEAKALAGDARSARAAILTAAAFQADPGQPGSLDAGEAAVAAAVEADDPLMESAALDKVSLVHLAAGRVDEAVRAVRRRLEILAPVRLSPASGIELADALGMAAEILLAAGDVPAAREYAMRIAELPFFREEGHLAYTRFIRVAAVSGEWPELVPAADRFKAGWVQAGRPSAGGGGVSAAYLVQAVLGMRGDTDGQAEWLAIAQAMARDDLLEGCDSGYAPLFDAVAMLHRGDAKGAAARMAVDPADFRTWWAGVWRPWYAAVWVEAAVLAGVDDAVARLTRARRFTAANPVATAMLDRAAALAAGDRSSLPEIAARLGAAGCRYQWARTMILAGGAAQADGEKEMAAIGAVPMVV